MQRPHLYFTVIPETLIYSMLPPQEFGKYLSIGSQKLKSDQSIFFEVAPDFTSDYFPLDQGLARCRPHADGSTRRSTYVSVYRVLEHLPVAALGSLFLTTRVGLTLELTRGDYHGDQDDRLHMFQELAPVFPKVASSLGPLGFARHVTDPTQAVSMPRVAFADLRLAGLARDPAGAAADNLPYSGILHIRETLSSLHRSPEKRTRIINRDIRQDIHFPMVEGGFYVGDQTDFAFYPMPEEDVLRRENTSWWNSASRTATL